MERHASLIPGGRSSSRRPDPRAERPHPILAAFEEADGRAARLIA